MDVIGLNYGLGFFVGGTERALGVHLLYSM